MRPNSSVTAAVLIAAAALLAACGSDRSDDAPEARRFLVTGYVERVIDDGARLMIDHEEIPNYMPPMIMQFTPSDPAEARDLAPGQQIRFDFVVEPTRSWIENIEPTGLARDPNSRRAAFPETAARPLEPNEAMPDYAFLDENGETVRLSDYRGSVVALTFIFTRCPVPEFCPAMMRNFGNVDQILSDAPPLPAPWKLVTISFDPENDTPEVMRRYGEAFDYDPENWDLLTSRTLDAIEGIASNVGLRFGKSDGTYLHNLRTVVLDPEGRVHRIFTNEDWTPEELAAEMLNAARNP